MVLSDPHTQVFICIYSLLVHQVLDRVLSDLALHLKTRLWYKLSYKTQREVQIFTRYIHTDKFLWLRVFFTTFVTIFNILHIVMIGGGGAMW